MRLLTIAPIALLHRLVMPPDNYFQAAIHRILPPVADPDTAGPGEGFEDVAVQRHRRQRGPVDGTTVPAAPPIITGYAFAGDSRRGADRRRVHGDISRQAHLERERNRRPWRRWSLSVNPKPGPSITARAWDTTGAVQPESAAASWNPKGYANHSWAQVHPHANRPPAREVRSALASGYTPWGTVGKPS